MKWIQRKTISHSHQTADPMVSHAVLQNNGTEMARSVNVSHIQVPFLPL